MWMSSSVVSSTAMKSIAMVGQLALVAVFSTAFAVAQPRPASAQPNKPDRSAVISAPLPAAPTPPVLAQPMVTSALLPGHWRLEGAQYVWITPDKEPRPVENQPAIEGYYVYHWDDGQWVWVPPHYGGD